MKCVLFFVFATLCSLTMNGQSRYISYTPYAVEDRNCDIDGKGGILILSKHGDLAISVINAPKAQIEPKGQKSGSGYYEYTVVVDRNETTNPKIEVSRRGDINRTSFVVTTKSNYLRAYLIDDVEKPITMEDMTAGNDAILDEKLAELEISTAISGLRINCPIELGATIKQYKKQNDETITVYSVIIPIQTIVSAREDIEKLRNEYDALDKRINTLSDSEFDRHDQLEELIEDAEQKFYSMCTIDIYAAETNHLPIDVSDMGPRNKKCYGILALKTIVREHVSKCSGMMEEASKLFADRKYEDAKRVYNNALHAIDAPDDIKPAILSQISQCDTCILYDNLVKRAMLKIIDLKKSDNVSQMDIQKYYTAAIDFMTISQKYNPCEFYSQNISRLESYIDNMPVAMKITTVRWVFDKVSGYEDGAMSNVEIWAYYGEERPQLKQYSKERSFKKIINKNSSAYKLLGTTDNNGVLEMELIRKSLPTGFFFRPKYRESSVAISYMEATDVMNQSKGEYNKKQFRMKIYIKR